IPGFAMYPSAWDDPTIAGGATGINLWTWFVFHVLAEGKMRALFSMVFGASAILLTSRVERKGGSSGDIYYRRPLWLMLFGIVHAYLLWYGDILYSYALCGLALSPFRRLSPRVLLVIGLALAVFDPAWWVHDTLRMRDTIALAAKAEAAAARGERPTREQKDALRERDEWRTARRPTREELTKDAA